MEVFVAHDLDDLKHIVAKFVLWLLFKPPSGAEIGFNWCEKELFFSFHSLRTLFRILSHNFLRRYIFACFIQPVHQQVQLRLGFALHIDDTEHEIDFLRPLVNSRSLTGKWDRYWLEGDGPRSD